MGMRQRLSPADQAARLTPDETALLRYISSNGGSIEFMQTERGASLTKIAVGKLDLHDVRAELRTAGYKPRSSTRFGYETDTTLEEAMDVVYALERRGLLAVTKEAHRMFYDRGEVALTENGMKVLGIRLANDRTHADPFAGSLRGVI